MSITVVTVPESGGRLLDAAVALGNLHTKTLGLLTPQAYLQSAEVGGLLVALAADEVVGYALFGLPKRKHYVRLTHLCVADEHRGQGIARQLIEAIRAGHGNRLGIRAKCRRNYDLSGMWASLGFVPPGESVGRGHDRETLDTWWLDFGHPDLFTDMQSNALLIVGVDHSVLEGIADRSPDAESREPRIFKAAWLEDETELAYTPQLMLDIRSVTADTVRNQQRSEVARMRKFAPAAEAVAERHRELMDGVRAQNADLSMQPHTGPLLQYVAEASCAGLHVLATCNPDLLALADVAREIGRVKVVRPAVVALHVDELRQAQVYRPADLLGTAFTTGQVAADAEGELTAFFDHSEGEKGSTFEDRLRAFEQDDSVVWRRELLRDGEGRPVALYVWAHDGRTLTVAMLRTAEHPLEQTLARQLLFLLKNLGRECGVETVRITDPFPSPAAAEAAGLDGFFSQDNGLTALLVDVCGTAREVSATANRITNRLKVPSVAFGAGLQTEIASAVERAWWPAKIIDSDIPCFIVPIKPRWSADLFNIPAPLTPRGELGISREHVYYRSPGRRGESVPARLLWYVSQDSSGPQGKMAIGCSRLDEVLIDTPDALHSQFEHLGVYGQAEVRKVARGHGAAMALRFSDTELFPAAVTLGRLEALAGDLGQPLSLMSLSKISSELFQAVYEEGHRKT